VPLQKVMNWCARAHAPRVIAGRRAGPADLPPGEREGLARRRDHDRPRAHAGQRRQRHVLALVDQVLVDLVGDRQQVVLLAQRRDASSSSARENTLPVGLCGVFNRIARVFGLMAAASAAGSKLKSGARSVTKLQAPRPPSRYTSRYES
jgi:hypothetical protein